MPAVRFLHPALLYARRELQDVGLQMEIDFDIHSRYNYKLFSAVGRNGLSGRMGDARLRISIDIAPYAQSRKP